MDSDLSLGGLFADARFRDGFLMHLILSSWTFLGVYRYFSRMRDSDPSFDASVPVRGRFRFVLSRWLAIYVTGLFIPFFPTLMVVAYCAATVYFELFPQRVLSPIFSRASGIARTCRRPSQRGPPTRRRSPLE
jgi:hypothetical protein